MKIQFVLECKIPKSETVLKSFSLWIEDEETACFFLPRAMKFRTKEVAESYKKRIKCGIHFDIVELKELE